MEHEGGVRLGNDLAMKTEQFTPRCLSCSYDLSGLPDGRCPECGVKFTYVSLMERAIGNSADRADLRSAGQGLTAAMLAIAYLLALVSLLSKTDTVGGANGGLVIIWVIVAAWMGVWLPSLRLRPQYLVVVVLPTVASTWELWTQFSEDPLRIALVTSVLGLALLALAARSAPRLVFAAMGMTLACLLVSQGAMLREAGVAASTNGYFGTVYAAFLPGKMNRQYPLTPDDAVKFGSWVAWSGVALLCGLVGYVVLAWGRLRSEWGRTRT